MRYRSVSLTNLQEIRQTRQIYYFGGRRASMILIAEVNVLSKPKINSLKPSSVVKEKFTHILINNSATTGFHLSLFLRQTDGTNTFSV